jgi:hypothetical protein
LIKEVTESLDRSVADFQTVFHTAELSTNSLGDFVVFWDSDFQTASFCRGPKLHEGRF